MGLVDGKVAIVTGAGHGVGRGEALLLAKEGAKVVVNDLGGSVGGEGADKRPAEEVADVIRSGGGEAVANYDDVADWNGAKNLIQQAVDSFGRLDILVNNAGTAIPKKFEEATLEELDHMIDLNVRGTFVATQAALKHMKNGGRIIMIGSCVGERCMTPGLVPYAATKGAVKMLTQGLSREVGSRGITVNNIQPGPIDTDLNPAAGEWATPQKAATALNRYGSVDEVASLVAFVASPEAAYITGANLTVDGGTNA
jgi:3-oxoacyl-[acyl-carrier protein] reductase